MGIETALLVTAVAGAAVSAAGQIKSGMNTATANRYQGEEEVAQASQEKQAAGQQGANQDYAANQVLGRISANAGAAGVTPAGSPSVVATNSESEATTNDMYTRYSGNLAALKDVYAAKELNYQGSQAKVAGFVGAGQTLTSSITGAIQTKLGWLNRGATPGSSSSPTWGSLFNSSSATT